MNKNKNKTLEEQKKVKRTEGRKDGHPQCAPVSMQDTSSRATQDGQDQAVKFHVEPGKDE